MDLITITRKPYSWSSLILMPQKRVSWYIVAQSLPLLPDTYKTDSTSIIWTSSPAHLHLLQLIISAQILKTILWSVTGRDQHSLFLTSDYNYVSLNQRAGTLILRPLSLTNDLPAFQQHSCFFPNTNFPFSLRPTPTIHNRYFKFSKPTEANSQSHQINDGEASCVKKELSWASPFLNFASNNFLPLALTSGEALGLGNPSLGCLADKYYLSKFSTFGIFFISGLTLQIGAISAAAEAWHFHLQPHDDDVEELAYQLGLGTKFYVLGFSMGGEAVRGILKHIPHRLAGAALVAPVVDYWWPGFPANLSTEAY